MQGLRCLAQGHNSVMPVRLKPAAHRAYAGANGVINLINTSYCSLSDRKDNIKSGRILINCFSIIGKDKRLI